AQPLAVAVRDTNYLSLIYNLISNIYFYQTDYKKATEFTTKSLRLAQLTGNEINQAHAFASLGTQAHAQNDTAKALDYYYKAYGIFKKKENLQRQAALLGNIAILRKDKRTAIELKLEAQKIWDSLSPTYPDAIKNTGNLGLDYYDIVMLPEKFPVTPGGIIPAGKAERLALSEKYLRRAVTLSKEVGNMEWNWTYNKNLSDLMEAKGDTKSALFYLKDSWKVYDSLYSQDNKNKLAEISSRQEIELKDKQIVINKLALSNQRKQRIGLLLGLVFLTVTGSMFYIQSRNRKRTNTTLLQLNNDLDEANKVKAKFFAILSHDLRGPVANLISFLEIQQDAPELISAEDAIKYNKNISASAANLLQTMEAMLLWSKEQMQQFKPDIKMIPVSSLFAYLKNFFSNSSDVELNFNGADNLSVSTDENYLQTIMHNLTANAIKILKDKPGGKIEWKAWMQDGKTFLAITDNGPGMKEAQVAALYNENTAINSRTGFGLHLIRDLAKTIRCKITMHSDSGNGTTFTLAV
ncbi:MAG: tetratricopeptide repeat-containing sensor histidine kinase, partial [Ferruginibacter sp.]